MAITTTKLTTKTNTFMNKMKNNYKKLTLMLLITALLSACAQKYSVTTNVDKENFKEYFSPSKVKIYQNEQDISGEFKLIGLVEGDDCQRKAHLAAPDEIIARTQARKKAFDNGANGIIFTSCIDIESKSCVAQRVCYGKMYKIAQPQPTN